MEGSTVHLALLCSPGMSHLIPFAQLASRLAKVHKIAITLLMNSDNPTNPAYLSLLKSLPDGVNAITLPAPPPNSIPDGASLMTQIILTVLSSLPHVQSTLANLLSTKRLSALVIDLFSFPAKEMAGQLGLPCYLFYPSPYTALALNLHAPELVKSYQGTFKDLPEPVKLPGCVPITTGNSNNGISFLTVASDFYQWHQHILDAYSKNSFMALASILQMLPKAIA